MSWLRFFHRARRDAELAKDIQFYLDAGTEDNAGRGMTGGYSSRASAQEVWEPDSYSRGGLPHEWPAIP